jgi:lipopolysaccharide transport system ATP-binding protein
MSSNNAGLDLNDSVVTAVNLGKVYRTYSKPSNRLIQMAARGMQHFLPEKGVVALDGYIASLGHDFWALDQVSFQIKRGQTVGVIGRNGSGKSTLLQIICGTLPATRGSIDVRGRIAALLELGSGFNPEYTGMENVYLNGQLLGLSREEVQARMEKIAAFADIGDFLHKPVKTYSSGMFVRLAFAVIAHVDADILVIDEALAVGDMVFTQKCMRFLRKFKETGTLIFVSHDMGSVLSLCDRAIWLQRGRLRQEGPAKNVAESYLQESLQEVYGRDALLETIKATEARIEDRDNNSHAHQKSSGGEGAQNSLMIVSDNLSLAKGWKTGAGEIFEVSISNLSTNASDVLRGGELMRMKIRARVFCEMTQPILGFLVRDRLGQDLFGENTLPFTALHPSPVRDGNELVAEFEFHLPMLPNGQYSVMASLANGTLVDHVQHHWLHDALVIAVNSSTVRWGLVGVPISKLSLKVVD